MKTTLIAVAFATIYGFTLRLCYGFFGDSMEIMSLSFIVFAPVIIGFLTVILIPTSNVTSASGAFFKPWLTSLAILILTIAFKVEGTICWLMIFPLFAILAGIGGLVAFYVRQKFDERRADKEFDNRDRLSISFVLLLPLLLAVAEGDRTSNRKDFTISKTIIIPASPQQVWQSLTNINTITGQEHSYSLSDFMGFPKHLQTTLDTVSVGGKRLATYEHGLYFDETIVALEKDRSMVLDIKVDPNKIPPTVMDEHIVIGGKHLDILQDSYTLESLPGNHCRLTLTSRFYINTPFNWYAGIWADYLMSDILQSELNLISQRSTALK